MIFFRRVGIILAEMATVGPINNPASRNKSTTPIITDAALLTIQIFSWFPSAKRNAIALRTIGNATNTSCNIKGTRNIQNTLLYTQLISFESDEYHSATAKNVQDAQKLIEAGFDYVCEFNEVKIFKKRK
jgi:uncharacterized protein YfaQ (DUF2300 family)